ncbi:MAG TPA: hypothetical protein VIA18_29335, partial [Polyangia bacterium]|nr:hypothetical protein [Polyangia bacterium]
MRTDGAAAPGDADKRCPQCWQNANPTGVPLPHAGQIAFGADGCDAAGATACGVDGVTTGGCAAIGDDATTAGDGAADVSTAIVAALPIDAGPGTATALDASEVPHILQKFMPGGFCVPHALQVVPAAAAGLGAAAAGSSRCPQSWQNSEPSRLTFPQWVQRGISRVTSGVQREIQVYGPRYSVLNNGAASSQIMKVSRRKDQIKPTAFLIWMALAGCAPVVAQAPFSYRNDTVEPGDLLGAFDGRVVDGLSGKPLPGAIVQANWAFEVGRGLVGPAGGVSQTVAADVDGHYFIDRLATAPLRSRVSSVVLVVYQR